MKKLNVMRKFNIITTINDNGIINVNIHLLLCGRFQQGAFMHIKLIYYLFRYDLLVRSLYIFMFFLMFIVNL